MKRIKTPEDRKALSTDFLTRAAQDFAEVKRHDDLTMVEILILRTRPSGRHCMLDSQCRYSF